MLMNMVWAFGLFLLGMLIMPLLIRFLSWLKAGQTEREEGLASHQVKNGTPTMGGILFIGLPIIAMVGLGLFGYVQLSWQVILIMLSFFAYGLIGFLDDFIIVVQKNNAGLSAKAKFLLQLVLAVIFCVWYASQENLVLVIPVVHWQLALGYLYFPFALLMFTAESNATNLTDGLDGLCTGLTIIALIPLMIWAKQADLLTFLCLVQASLLAYLWYNRYPAKIFMGDTGSLALGGLLASVAMIEHQEILLVIIGGVFVVEVLSVMIQVTYFRKTGRRIFLMAPLHHHFEKKGWTEIQVVTRFWLVGLFLAAIGLWLGGM